MKTDDSKLCFFAFELGRDQVEPQTPCGDGYACEEGEFCDEYWDGPNSGEKNSCHSTFIPLTTFMRESYHIS